MSKEKNKDFLKEAEKFEESRYLGEDTKSDAMKMSKLCKQVGKLISEMVKIYYGNDDMNEVQPKSFFEVIPMSLDELSGAWEDASDDWKKVK